MSIGIKSNIKNLQLYNFTRTQLSFDMEKLFFTFHGDVHEIKFSRDYNGRPLFSSVCILNALGYNKVNKYVMKCSESTIGVHMNTYFDPECLYFYTKRECCTIIQNCEAEISQTLLTWVSSVKNSTDCVKK